VMAMIIGAACCSACANSVLRNAAEAGLDTVVARSTPTPPTQ